MSEIWVRLTVQIDVSVKDDDSSSRAAEEVVKSALEAEDRIRFATVKHDKILVSK